MVFKLRLLRDHIGAWRVKLSEDPQRAECDKAERASRIVYYQSRTADKINSMGVQQFYEFISKLWAMRVWNNKRYVIDGLIRAHGFAKLKNELAKLLWDQLSIEERWDHFRSSIKGIGPAKMSELLCYSHPDEYMLWNQGAYCGLHRLGVDDLPRYNYQITAER